LFKNQDALDDRSLLAYAAALALDLRRFERDLLEHRFAERVRRDFMSGVRSGVNGTPTFFVDDLRHDGPWHAEALREALLGSDARLREHAR
jgi:predicted DsbA family dithiol-disulfide isomerase